MPATLLMLPPQTKTTHQWAERLALDVPDMAVIVAEDANRATRAIAESDCAFGTLPRALLAAATRLRWLQAPQAAPPAGWYYPELIEHPVVVTNFREIYNDHIGAHIMAFVLAFARGLHQYLPQQLERQWRPAPPGDRQVAEQHQREADAVSLDEGSGLVVVGYLGDLPGQAHQGQSGGGQGHQGITYRRVGCASAAPPRRRRRRSALAIRHVTALCLRCLSSGHPPSARRLLVATS